MEITILKALKLRKSENNSSHNDKGHPLNISVNRIVEHKGSIPLKLHLPSTIASISPYPNFPLQWDKDTCAENKNRGQERDECYLAEVIVIRRQECHCHYFIEVRTRETNVRFIPQTSLCSAK
ncbi:hypothetical protein TNCT_40171 [Trichonephila clavata]|uniref:Uncharacterized protein n=1 Tax=Trichonephila clavata TaxID=2740835 RepID=A0A8X6FA91_TRICU|nr:hypothetical protein TNCT_40171 [Trichonephila clavata]